MTEANREFSKGELSGDALDDLHKSLVFIKLAAYATDAMRVLDTLQRHADGCPGFDQTVKAVCRDWRNPGSIDEPADLISEALLQISGAMAHSLRDS